jgi:proton-translocating NADH-quinone oxidoreductase chain N
MWALLLVAGVEVARGAVLTFAVGALALHIDGLSLLLAALAVGVCTLVLLQSGAEQGALESSEKHNAMLLATTGAMIGMGCARDLFNLWVWFEALMFASFLLATFYRDRPASLDAGIKYLTQSAIGSLLIVLGIALLLAHTGTLALDAVPTSYLPPGLLAAGALFVVGFGVKCALVPLHTWLPDVYAAAPSRITALLSGAVTLSGLIALMRALSPLASAASTWGLLLIIAGSVNTLVGSLLALRQRELKRLLAYSSISHIGTILLGLGISLYASLPNAGQAALFHLLTLGAMDTLAFLAVAALIHTGGRREDRRAPLTLSDVRGAAHSAPLPGYALALTLLSLGGLPPLAGFMSKWQVFAAGFASPDPLVRGAIAFAALNILLAMAYYLPTLLALFDTSAAPPQTQRHLPTLMIAPLWVLCALIVAVGVVPDAARVLTDAASAALFSGGIP